MKRFLFYLAVLCVAACTTGCVVPNCISDIIVEDTRIAAEAGDAEDQYLLGCFYEAGRIVAEDRDAAAKWIRKAAEKGHAKAQCRLGLYYLLGFGVAEDMNEAVKWIRKSAEQGCAEAQYVLAACYAKGTGVPYDMSEAMCWLDKSAAQEFPDAVKMLNHIKEQFNIAKPGN